MTNPHNANLIFISIVKLYIFLIKIAEKNEPDDLLYDLLNYNSNYNLMND